MSCCIKKLHVLWGDCFKLFNYFSPFFFLECRLLTLCQKFQAFSIFLRVQRKTLFFMKLKRKRKECFLKSRERNFFPNFVHKRFLQKASFFLLTFCLLRNMPNICRCEVLCSSTRTSSTFHKKRIFSTIQRHICSEAMK